MSIRDNSKNNSKKLPIEIVTELLASALIITDDYKNNKKHDLSEIELKMLGMFVAELEKSYTIAIYIAHCLRQRMNGEDGGFD
ncbi:MAG: hypothetical protein AABY33_07775 [Pseudomonadota bacterium]